MKRQGRYAHRQRLYQTVVVVCLAVLACGGGLWAYWRLHHPHTVQQRLAAHTQTVQQAPLAKPAQPEYTAVQGDYLLSGTIVLDRVVVSAAQGDHNQPFSQMSTFGTHDAGIADLECPVTDGPNRMDINIDSPHFNCRPDWLPALKKYYQIVKLSGNHMYDAGPDGFAATLTNLQNAGIQSIGHFNPHADPTHNCDLMALPVRLEKPGGGEDTGTLPMAFCSFNYKTLFPTPYPGELELIGDYAKTIPVFGFLQDGTEYQTAASPAVADLAQKFIDQGAEFVLGNGTHTVENTEAYKGKLIAFSMGNFIFDQVDPETRRNVSFNIKMSVAYDSNVAKWLAFSKTCDVSKRGDDCLKAARAAGLQKFAVHLTYKPLAGVGGAHAVTHLSSPAEQQSILDRLEWSKTCSQLTNNVCAQ